MTSPMTSPMTWIGGKDFDALAALFAELCVAAGAIVMDVFTAPRIETRFKNDASPVSDADERAEAFLLAELSRRLPGVPAIAEEGAARGETPKVTHPHDGAFLLIDPLDGTREFVEREKEFTVNVALVEGGRPRAGAIYAPALGLLWFGGTRAYSAQVDPGAPLPPSETWRELHTRRRPVSGLVALASRSHLDEQTRAFLDRAGVAERISAASSLKFCRIAEGVADVYPRFGPTMEWDIAAGDAILTAAGGAVLGLDGAPFRYGKAAQDYRNGPFIAWGDPWGDPWEDPRADPRAATLS
jgi:3'(2'), 5'-bisphosphate nucleotidase